MKEMRMERVRFIPDQTRRIRAPPRPRFEVTDTQVVHKSATNIRSYRIKNVEKTPISPADSYSRDRAEATARSSGIQNTSFDSQESDATPRSYRETAAQAELQSKSFDAVEGSPDEQEWPSMETSGGLDTSFDSHESEGTARSHRKRRLLLAELLREEQTKQIDPEGDLPDRPDSPEEFLNRRVDFGLSPAEDLPKFAAVRSPIVTPRNSQSPELSPILKDEETTSDSDVGGTSKEYPTLTTEGESAEVSGSQDDENQEIDEFPVDTDIAMMTGIKDQGSREERFVVEPDYDSKYGSFDMDELDLQLISVRRPFGKEYGDDEVSL